VTPSSDDTAVLSAVPAVPEPFDDRDDSLASALAKAAPRRWWNRGTLVLGAFALLLGGFLGGLEVQKHYGTSTAAATTGRTGARTGGFPGGAFGGGAAPTAAAPAAAGPTTGKVKLVNGKLKDLKAGDTVSVQGTADTEGTVTATTVTESKG
jgi:hypothetical protein